jgi:hypothetical protein
MTTTIIIQPRLHSQAVLPLASSHGAHHEQQNPHHHPHQHHPLSAVRHQHERLQKRLNNG